MPKPNWVRRWVIPWERVKRQTLTQPRPPLWRFSRIWVRVLRGFAPIAIREIYLQDLMTTDK